MSTLDTLSSSWSIARNKAQQLWAAAPTALYL